MAEKRFIIEVRTKGFARATRDFKQLDTGGRKYRETANRMRNSTEGLIGSLGSLRNRILVYTFAIGGAIAAMNRFISAASGFQDVKTRLVGLTGSVEKAESAFKTFNQIAATTPFQLQDVVNAGAQLEAFGVDAEATLSSVTDLAAFMGTTATEAASSLGRAFAGGAGSADILREKGILQLVKDSQGIKDLTQITLPEFRQALLSAMVEPTAGIAGSADRLSKTFSGAMSNMNDAVTRFTALLGGLALPALTQLANNTEQFFRSLDLKRIAEVTTSVGALATAFGILRMQALITTSVLGGFTKVAKALTLAAVVLGIDKMFQWIGAFEALETNTNNASSAIKSQKQILEEYIETLGDATEAQSTMAERNTEHRENQAQRLKGYEDEVAALEAQIAAFQGHSLARQEELKHMIRLSDEQKIAVDQIEILTKKLQELKDAKEKDAEATANQVKQAEFLEDIRQDTFARAAKELEDMRTELDKNAEEAQDFDDIAQQLAGSVNVLAGAMNNASSKSDNLAQRVGRVLQVMGGLLQLGGPATASIGSVFTAFGSGMQNIAHTGGLVKNNGIQRFATGGMVQGQDNVPILAQAGEFVMQRSAVQNIGLNNLAALNSGASPGNVTVNITAPLVDEHVVDVLTPAIHRAIANGQVNGFNT